jgi:outer membrane protein assembly factor BamB
MWPFAVLVAVAVCASGPVAPGRRSERKTAQRARSVAAVSPGPGSRLWVARYDSSGWAAANAVAVSLSGGTVFVTGSRLSKGTFYPSYITVAYDAATGARLWVARYGHSGTADYASAVAVSPSGGMVFVTGGTPGTSGSYATVAYNAATGAQLWAARYNGDDYAFSVAVSPTTGAVFVTGKSYPLGSDLSHSITVAYHG